jgi:hydroxypyruvate isomerase
MKKLDVCIETFFVDLPWQERISRIAALGYRYVEIWHPEATFDGEGLNTTHPKNPGELRAVAEESGVTVGSFVINGWDGSFGGCPLRRADHSQFLEQVERMMEFADASGVSRAIIMPGTVDTALSETEMFSATIEAFGRAADIAEGHGVTLLVEPLNTTVDHPGYLLGHTADGLRILRELDRPNVKLLYDIYHMQIMDGNLVAAIVPHISSLGHVHIAGVPGRNEPDRCEIDYSFVMDQLVAAGYDGLFGLEYFPREESAVSLGRQLDLAK